MIITSEFSGGNAVLKKLSELQYSIEPELRDTRTTWFYWCFKIIDPLEKTYQFFIKPGSMTKKGYAFSTDQGLNWQWGENDSLNNDTISFTPTKEQKEIIFCVSMGYTLNNWNHFITTLEKSTHWELTSLCNTRKQRSSPLVRVHATNTPKYKFIITARHHCCEVIANYLLEGYLHEILKQKKQNNCNDIEIVLIPFIDLDGSEEGDQGKNRFPHDHNRDYSEAPIYPEVKALKEEINQNKEIPTLTLDVHCPHLKGNFNEQLYFVGSSNKDIYKEQNKLLTLIEKNNNSSLPFTHNDILPFGQGWNKEPNDGVSNATWCSLQSHVKMATSLEIPYGLVGENEINQNSAREIGSVIAKAMIQYTQQK